MIYVDRKSIPIPDIFLLNAHEKAFEETKVFFMGAVRVKQQRFDFDWLYKNLNKITEHLAHLFHNKCAYCEQIIDLPEIDHFRCKQNAKGFSDTSPNHYWWLAYEWNNLYLSCPQCNRNKASLFPVKGKRIEFGEDIETEENLLLDPCSERDFGQLHLIFMPDGKVVSGTEQGRTTIDVFKLNRESLIVQRKRAIEETKKAVSHWKLMKTPGLEIKRALAPDQTFISARIQFLLQLDEDKAFLSSVLDVITQTAYVNSFSSAKGSILDISLKKISKKGVTDEHIKNKKISGEYESFKSAQQKTLSVENESEEHQKAYLLESDRWIQRIEIHNFRIIRDLTLVFPSWQPEQQEPWVALLGENGSGKSTILQCVALAMMGQEHLDRLVDAGTIDPRDCISYGDESVEGYIRIMLSDTKDPYELRFNRTNPKFISSVPHAQFILMGYGSTRLLNKNSVERKERFVKIQNLFDPFASLQNVLAWFSNPENLQEEQFNNIALLLKQILPIDKSSYFDRVKTKNGFELRLFGEFNEDQGSPLSHLSSGYQSIIAFILDIALTVIEKFPNVSDAQGIVLVDEIETHLHPRWKMQIVSQLRKTFTRLRFIVTTHEPLCLRGLQEGEVILIQLDTEKNIHAVQNLPSPSRMRIDELLLSQHFGLSTVYDPTKEFLLSEFFTLAAKQDRNQQEEERLKQLQEQVRTSKILDDTTYKFVEMTSKYFKENRVGLEKEEIKADTIKAVGDIWKKALSGDNPN